MKPLLVVIAVCLIVLAADRVAMWFSFFRHRFEIRRQVRERQRWREWHDARYQPQSRPVILNFDEPETKH
jgi:hypothetical protein